MFNQNKNWKSKCKISWKLSLFPYQHGIKINVKKFKKMKQEIINVCLVCHIEELNIDHNHRD